MPAASPDTSTATALQLDAEELRAWRGFLQVHASVMQKLDAEMRAAHGMSVSSYEVLMFLADAEGGRLRMSEIADRVLLSRSGLTRLVDRLESLGQVERRACSDDGRGMFARITDAGREVLDAARRTHLAGVRREFLDRLSPADRRALGDVWERIA